MDLCDLVSRLEITANRLENTTQRLEALQSEVDANVRCNIEYVVCQAMSPDYTIVVKCDEGPGPLFLRFLEEHASRSNNYNRLLQIGDLVRVISYVPTQRNDNRFEHSGNIIPDGLVTNYNRLRHNRTWALAHTVVKRNLRSRDHSDNIGGIVVESHGDQFFRMYRRQGAGVTEYQENDRVAVNVVTVPENWWIGINYVLPNHSQRYLGNETQVTGHKSIPIRFIGPAEAHPL